MKNLGKAALLILITCIFAIFAYWYLPSTFFQQDEWSTFGRFIFLEATGSPWDIFLYPFLMGKGHFIPFPFYQIFLELKLFGLSFAPFAYISILTHIANSLLLFYLAFLLTKNKIIAFFSSILFSVNSISAQSVIWLSASSNTQGALLFLLLSLIFILRYFKNGNRKNYYIGLAFFLIGLFFKETILFFFILAPIVWVLFVNKKRGESLWNFLKPLILSGGIYFLIRVILFLIPSPVLFNSSNTVNFSVASDIIRFISLPFRILSQALIPQSVLIQLSNQTILSLFPQFVLTDGSPNPFIAQTIMFDRVVYFLSVLVILLGLGVYRLFRERKENALAKAVLFSFSLIMLSSFPFAFIPGEAANFSIFEPRDLHVASIGASLFLALFIYCLTHLILRNKKYIIVLTFIIMFPLLLMHTKLTRAEIYKILGMSRDRESILNTIIMRYPLLGQNTIFYLQSNKAYYGLPEEDKIPPFQSGFGQTLLVWYYFHDKKVPTCFFKNSWLYDLLSQGYRRCGKSSFGYYRNFQDLRSAQKKYNFSPNDVISFSWDDNSRKLSDVSDQVHKLLIKVE